MTRTPQLLEQHFPYFIHSCSHFLRCQCSRPARQQLQLEKKKKQENVAALHFLEVSEASACTDVNVRAGGGAGWAPRVTAATSPAKNKINKQKKNKKEGGGGKRQEVERGKSPFSCPSVSPSARHGCLPSTGARLGAQLIGGAPGGGTGR